MIAEFPEFCEEEGISSKALPMVSNNNGVGKITSQQSEPFFLDDVGRIPWADEIGKQDLEREKWLSMSNSMII
jgi:hypothetical protein